MSKDDSDGDTPSMSRRSVLATTGTLGVGSLIGSSGVAAADGPPDHANGPPDHANGPPNQDRQLWVEDGRFQLDLDPEEIGAFEYRTWNAVVQDFNRAIEAGHMSIEEAESVGISQASQGQTERTTIELHSSPSEMIEGDR